MTFSKTYNEQLDTKIKETETIQENDNQFEV